MRDALQFDRRAISLQGGLLAAIPVAAVLALGTAVWSSVAGVTMGAGAMLVGIAWRVAGGRPPLALLATDATVMATSTFVGCLTGSILWLHFGLLAVWALAGGLLVALGNRGGVIGTQAMIAFVVFGRFSQPAAASLALAGLVLAGGFAQVVFQVIVRWPTPLRWQRAATANAYRALAGLARGSAETSTLPIAQALDEAQASLSSLTLFGDPALMTLRSLVNEGLRMRIQLSTIHALMSRRPGAAAAGDGASTPDRGGARILELAAAGLDLAARAIEGDRAARAELPAHIEKLSSDTAEHALTPDASGLALSRRLAALAGQLRAVGSLAVTAGEASGLRDRRPHARTNRRFEQARADLAVLRANASLQSPAGRHARASRSGRAHRGADLTTPAAQPELLDGGRGRHHAPAGVRCHLHPRRRAGGGHRSRCRTGRRDRGRAPPDRCRDRRTRRRARLGGLRRVSGQLRARVCVHHRGRRVPAERDRPGHACDGVGAPP